MNIKEQRQDILTETSLHQGVDKLVKREPVFDEILQTYGYPPLWARQPGFPTLVRIILEQQVSLASALAAFKRLEVLCGSLTPQMYLTLDDVTLRQIGFSRQKTIYCRALALEIIEHRLDLDNLSGQDEETIRTRLIKLKGIGPWTVDIYLLLALCRPDVLPKNDLALIIAVQRAFGLSSPPSQDELECMSEAWRPFRAVAVRLLWHFYLSGGKKTAKKIFTTNTP